MRNPQTALCRLTRPSGHTVALSSTARRRASNNDRNSTSAVRSATSAALGQPVYASSTNPGRRYEARRYTVLKVPLPSSFTAPAGTPGPWWSSRDLRVGGRPDAHHGAVVVERAAGERGLRRQGERIRWGCPPGGEGLPNLSGTGP